MKRGRENKGREGREVNASRDYKSLDRRRDIDREGWREGGFDEERDRDRDRHTEGGRKGIREKDK